MFKFFHSLAIYLLFVLSDVCYSNTLSLLCQQLFLFFQKLSLTAFQVYLLALRCNVYYINTRSIFCQHFSFETFSKSFAVFGTSVIISRHNFFVNFFFKFFQFFSFCYI